MEEEATYHTLNLLSNIKNSYYKKPIYSNLKNNLRKTNVDLDAVFTVVGNNGV